MLTRQATGPSSCVARSTRAVGREPLGEVAGDPEGGVRFEASRLHPPRIAAGDDDSRSFGGEKPGNLEPDPGGRPGDEADAVAKAEIHRRASLVAMTTLLLVRHGETDWNREGRWQGGSDTHLNELGREQAGALPRSSTARSASLYSSDLARARETAEISLTSSG